MHADRQWPWDLKCLTYISDKYNTSGPKEENNLKTFPDRLKNHREVNTLQRLINESAMRIIGPRLARTVVISLPNCKENHWQHFCEANQAAWKIPLSSLFPYVVDWLNPQKCYTHK